MKHLAGRALNGMTPVVLTAEMPGAHRMAESVTFGGILTADNAISKGSMHCNVWGTHLLQSPALGTCAALVYSSQVPKTALEHAHQEAEDHVNHVQ